MKSLLQRVENENTYRNELYLINGFDKRLQPGVLGLQFGSTNLVGQGSGVATF